MTSHDDHRSGPLAARRGRNRAMAGVAGLAVVLGAGAYATTTLISQDDGSRQTTAFEVAPAATQHSSSVSAEPSPGATATVQTGKAAAAAMPTRSLSPEEADRVRKARDAAKNKQPVLKPLTPKPGLPTGAVEVTNTGSLKEGGSLRVVTAKWDLTGQRELLWAADKGERVGKARCTQTLRFSNNLEPKERPTVLLCWRTSKDRSVVTVAVNKEGRPSKKASVAEIQRQWAALR